MVCSDESPAFASVVPPRPFTAAEAADAARHVWKESGLSFQVVYVGLLLDLRPNALSVPVNTIGRMVRLTRAELRFAEVLWSLQGELRRIETVARAVRHIRQARERERRTRGFGFLRGKGRKCRG